MQFLHLKQFRDKKQKINRKFSFKFKDFLLPPAISPNSFTPFLCSLCVF